MQPEFELGDGIFGAMEMIQSLMQELELTEKEQRSVVTRAIAASDRPGVKAFLGHIYRDLITE